MKCLRALVVVLILVVPVLAQKSGAFPSGRIVDLTYAFDANSVYWPTAEQFKLETDFEGMTDKGYFYSAYRYSAAEHGGTHLDSPVHFAKGHLAVDAIPLEQLIGPAIVVDVTAASGQNADYQIPVSDLTAWEREHGAIESGAIVLFRTGFSGRWPDAARYLGTADRGDAAVAKLHFPGLHPDAAKWLVDRKVHAVGLDTASIDYGQSTMYESHRVLYEHDIPAFENLTNLDRLPARGAHVVALPMKIKGGTGAPLRAIAIVPAR